MDNETRKGLREAGTAIVAAAVVGVFGGTIAYFTHRAYGTLGMVALIAGGLISWAAWHRWRSRRS